MRLTKKDNDGTYLIRENLPASWTLDITLLAIIEKLGAYEDAEELGEIPPLPVPVGGTAYYVQRGMITEIKVIGYNLCENVTSTATLIFPNTPCPAWAPVTEFGRSIFRTREEAEKAVKEERNGSIQA